ncbi:hypothetical protein N0V90_010816 [Kalmusia sp. IMI 367209]|nr:hypothetical protein N0V90_010816 [Kalmusia sp. IMI 367209]
MPFGADRDASIASYDALPILAAAICEAPDYFHKVTTTPNKGSVKNSCNYDVYIDSVGCGEDGKHELIAAGGTWSEDLRSCNEGSVVYKVTKGSAPSKPVQFEVAVKDGYIYYDISFLDCMRPNTTDLSGCPGWEGGVQCVPGKKGCAVYVCGPREYCDGSTYTVPEFGIIKDGPDRNEPDRIKAGAPVTSCSSAEGIAFEICAAN